MIRKGDNNSIVIVSGNTFARIKFSDIEMIEQIGRKIKVCTENDEYIFYDRINDMASALLGSTFYRAMKSLIVNFDKMVNIKDGVLIFESGRKFAIGRNNYLILKRSFKNYLMKYPPFSDCDTFGKNKLSFVSEENQTNNIVELGNIGNIGNVTNIKDKK